MFKIVDQKNSVLKKILVLLLAIISVHCSGQEELFGDHNGLSLSCMQSYIKGDLPNFTIGLSALVRKHVSISVGMLNSDQNNYPLLGLTFIQKPNKNENPVKFYLGLSYLKIINNHFGGVSFGLFKHFFPESRFPFALTSGFSGLALIKRDYDFEVNPSPTVGLIYTQGIFARNFIYPFIGFGSTYVIKEKIFTYSAMVGINIKMDTKKNNKDIPK